MGRRVLFWAWAGSLVAVILFLGALQRIDVMLAIGAGFGSCASLLKTWVNRDRMFDAEALADLLRHWGVTLALVAVLCREFDGLIPRALSALIAFP